MSGLEGLIALLDNGGTRSGSERRQPSATKRSPERRSQIDRRSGADRRRMPNTERKTGTERRYIFVNQSWKYPEALNCAVDLSDSTHFEISKLLFLTPRLLQKLSAICRQAQLPPVDTGLKRRATISGKQLHASKRFICICPKVRLDLIPPRKIESGKR